MSWNLAVAALNNATQSTFAEPVVLRHGGSSFQVNGVFQPAIDRFNSRSVSGGPGDMVAEGAVWERGDFVLSLRTTDITAVGIVAGDTATVSGRTFRIVDILDEFDGMADVILRQRGR